MDWKGSGASSQEQDECIGSELMFGPQTATRTYEDEGAATEVRINERIAPEELLTLPASVRGKRLADPRRRDLFSALRRRQDQAKRRRRRVSEGRPSEEVLAGMLIRTVWDGHACKAGLQPPSTSNYIALLRPDRPKPAVQYLHGPTEVGLGRAMGNTARDESDLDSGISEWASGDDGDTAAFEALLEEEARAVRRGHRRTSPHSSPSTSSSHDKSPEHSPRAGVRPPPVSAVRREELTSCALNSQPCSPTGFFIPTPMTEPTHEPMDVPASGRERSSSPRRVSPKPLNPSIEADERHQRSDIVSSGSDPDTRKRHEGVQCSGPPVDQAVQTSSLRLPRKTVAARGRVLQARSSIAGTALSPPVSDRRVDQNHGQPSRAIATVEKAVDNQARLPRTTLDTPSTCARMETSRSEGRADQMHVRVGLEGLQDADRGQHTTVWAVARGGNAAGPIMMLPLEGEGESGRGATVRGMRRFLRITDIAEREDDVGNEDRPRSTPEAYFARTPGDGGIGVCGGSNEGDANNPPHESSVMEVDCGRGDLGSLWEGLGSLGERLAGVGDRFDQLDEEICHDQQEIERCQREAQEEVEMATKYLEGVQAHRALHPVAKAPLPPQVPDWRSRGGANGKKLATESQTKKKTTSPTIDEAPRLAHSRESRDSGGKGESFGCGGAALEAEQELREARTILESIEKALRSDADKAASPSAPATPLAAELTVAVATTFEPEPKKNATISGVPASRRRCTGVNQPQHGKSHSSIDFTPRQEKELLGRSTRPADRSSSARSWSKGRSRASRTVFSKGGGEGVRSIGTAIAHFPTAVIAASKSKDRVSHARRRAWA